MEKASTSTGITSFMAPTITQYLPLPLRRRCRQLPWRRRGANICHQRLAHPNERVADYYRDYCKTTVIIQQFSSPNTPKYNGLKRDGHTIMDVARCMLNGAALPKSFWGKGRPPWCFYSTARRARPTVATRRTTGCSANTYSKGKVQPGKVANPARGQLNRENDLTGKMIFSLSPFAPENLASPEGFGSSSVPRQPAHPHTQAESGAYSRDSSRVNYNVNR